MGQVHIVEILILVIGVAILILQLIFILRRPDDRVEQLLQSLRALETGIDRISQAVRDEIATNRAESTNVHRQSREEMQTALKSFNDSVVNGMTSMADVQSRQFDSFSERLEKLTGGMEQKLDALQKSVEEKLTALREDNARQLDQMRATVDEKLQGTLEKRLGESFRQVSERLEQVHKGLGEMQSLASGVGDLKKVLTNVKTRGTWGEVQLGAMLEQVLTPDQYALNVPTKGGRERVEFAVKLPGRGDGQEDIVWLPIDAKFPVEDYQRLVEAQERADPEGVEGAAKNLEARIRACARDISEKYLEPPKTTDFGILFLPTEGLFAEVLRRPGLAESIQREWRVMIAGPTTLWSLLSSLQMGFRTLAIEKRSSEVWNLLGAVKTEWTKYGDLLQKVGKKLQDVSTTIESAERRSRAIGRKLRDVQELSVAETVRLLPADDSANDTVESGEEQEGE